MTVNDLDCLYRGRLFARLSTKILTETKAFHANLVAYQ